MIDYKLGMSCLPRGGFARCSPLAVAIALGLSQIGGAFGQHVIDLGELEASGAGYVVRDLESFRAVGIGDFNGDGQGDAVIGLWRSENWRGRANVVFGKRNSAPLSGLRPRGIKGLTIRGETSYDTLGRYVGAAGDVNGDGFDDLVVGAYRYTDRGLPEPPATYVIFGNRNGDDIQVDQLEAQGEGFTITSSHAYDDLISASSTGDFNGDGWDDLIVLLEARYQPQEFRAAYLVFGTANGRDVDLASLTTDRGFALLGPRINNVSGAGDVNGDGLSDVIVTTNADDNVVHVIFGSHDGGAVDLESLQGDERGFDILGNHFSFGHGTAAAGDVNGDGLADILIGARDSFSIGSTAMHSGNGYLVFGKADFSTVDIESFAQEGQGFIIAGRGLEYDHFGRYVAGVGDVNGDGLADISIGALKGGTNYPFGYVVFGKEGSETVHLGEPFQGGFTFEVDDEEANAWGPIYSAGDANGDGLGDMMVSLSGPFSDRYAGSAYVVFSPAAEAESASYLSKAGSGSNPALVPVSVLGNSSNRGNPDARAWIRFHDGDGVSTQTVTLYRNTEIVSGAPDSLANVVWHFQTDRASWSGADIRLQYLDSELSATKGCRDLEVYSSPSPSGPWTPVAALHHPRRNVLDISVDQMGYFIIAEQSERSHIHFTTPSQVKEGGLFEVVANRDGDLTTPLTLQIEAKSRLADIIDPIRQLTFDIGEPSKPLRYFVRDNLKNNVSHLIQLKVMVLSGQADLCQPLALPVGDNDNASLHRFHVLAAAQQPLAEQMSEALTDARGLTSVTTMIDLPRNAVIQLQSPDPVPQATYFPSVRTPVEINANGSVLERIDGEPFRFFKVQSAGSLVVRRVRMVGGNAGNLAGGGVLNFGSLELSDCVIENAYARLGGGIWSKGGSVVTLSNCAMFGNEAVKGGALFNRGETRLQYSQIYGNQANEGIIFNRNYVLMDWVEVYDNTSMTAGAIVGGELELDHTDIYSNAPKNCHQVNVTGDYLTTSTDDDGTCID